MDFINITNTLSSNEGKLVNFVNKIEDSMSNFTNSSKNYIDHAYNVVSDDVNYIYSLVNATESAIYSTIDTVKYAETVLLDKFNNVTELAKLAADFIMHPGMDSFKNLIGDLVDTEAN